MTIKKKKTSMTPEAKERRFLKLKEKRRRQKENKKLGKENQDGEKPKSEEGEAQVPNKSTECSPGKRKVKKEKKEKVIIPLDQMGEAMRQKILLKKENNRKRRQKVKSLVKEKKKAELSLLLEDGEKTAQMKILKKKKAEKRKKKRKSEGEEETAGEEPKAKIAKIDVIDEKNNAEKTAGNSEVPKTGVSKEDPKADKPAESDNASKIEKKRAKMKALKERTKLKKKIAAEGKGKLGTLVLDAAEAEKVKERSSEMEKSSGEVVQTKAEKKGEDVDTVTKGAGEEGEDKAMKKEDALSRSKAYKERKNAERKKKAKKRKSEDGKEKGDDTEDTEDGDATIDSTKSNSSSLSSSTSSPSKSKAGDKERDKEFSSLVAGLESKLKKVRDSNENSSKEDPPKEDASKEEDPSPLAEHEKSTAENPSLPTETPAVSKSEDLKAKLNSQLDGAKFRFINEKLYTMSSKEAVEMFKSDEGAFEIYHRGYSQQVAKWPVNPVDVIIGELKAIESPKAIVDFGCGEAKLAKELKSHGIHEVTSFDLVAANELVTACDMRRCPLVDGSIDVVVFCLSLMGTNMIDFVREASRILKKNGVLKIAEVESRCKNLKQFLRDLQKCGFKMISKNVEHKVFFLIDLKKVGPCKVSDSFPLALEPCFYKKR